MTTLGTTRFVVSSAVRCAVLEHCLSEPTTDDLLDELDASSSAVYNALDELEDDDLITEMDGSWTLTGGGQLVADLVTHHQRLDNVLKNLDEYLSTHDASPIPRPLRLRLCVLGNAEVIESSETDPQRTIRAVSDRLARSDKALAITPIYVDDYKTAMPDHPESRLLLDSDLVSDIRSDPKSQAIWDEETFTRLSTRVDDVDFALGLTDDALMVALPSIGGEYDPRTKVIATHDKALEWGRDLFEYHWERAEPLKSFLATEDE